MSGTAEKPKVALLVSGQKRTIRRVEDNINKFIQSVESNNNVTVDVYLSLDFETDCKITNVKNITVNNENIVRSEHFSHQMMRYNLGYNSIPNPEQYEWFIRTRPDLAINNFNTILETLDKSSVHARLRKSVKKLQPHEWSYVHYPITNIDVMDDQFFIVHKNVAKNAFSITRGTNPVTYDTHPQHMPECVMTYMFMSHGIPIKTLKVDCRIVR